MKSKRPYFIWDYDLTDKDITKILRGDNEMEKIWVFSRILESARFDDIWKYVSLRQVKEIFPKLRLKPPVKEAWQRALYVWN